MNLAARQPLPRPRPAFGAPKAACTADRAGGLTFDIALPEAAERWDAALVLGGGQSGGEPVRLPLVPVGEGVLRAVLPSTMRLAEGRWKARLVMGDGRPGRLRAGELDLRSLVGRAPRNGPAWLGVRVPYRTQNGGLSVRSWQRWPHAEVGELRLVDGVLTVRGALHGAELTSDASLEVRERRTDLLTRAFPVVADGRDFAATLPLRWGARASSSAPDAWRLLWLRPAPGVPAVRLARLLDDIADKRYHSRYPVVALVPGDQGVRPCYTGDNDLALRWERAIPPITYRAPTFRSPPPGRR